MLHAQDKVVKNYTNVKICNRLVVDAERREQIVQLIALLVKRKGYKQETLHCAVSIMDRYHSKIINDLKWTDAPNRVLMSTICVLLAAKL